MLEHIKNYFKMEYEKNDKTIIIEGPVSEETLNTYTFDEHLNAFRRPNDQFEALKEIASLEEGRIIVARVDNNIIGYVTFHRPDEFERWSEGNHPFILELGAVEVSDSYRNLRIGQNMLKLSMKDEYMENYIVLTTEYYWHWDLKGTGLDVYDYKQLMINLMDAAGFEVYMTNDPEITSHPANTLMARVGKHITTEQQLIFDEIRFKHRYFF